MRLSRYTRAHDLHVKYIINHHHIDHSLRSQMRRHLLINNKNEEKKNLNKIMYSKKKIFMNKKTITHGENRDMRAFVPEVVHR